MATSATAVLLPAQTGEAAGRHGRHNRRHHHASNEGFHLPRGGHHPSFRHGQQHPHLISQSPVLEELQASSASLPADSSPHRHQKPGHHHLYHTGRGPVGRHHHHQAPSSGSHGPHGRYHHPGLASRHHNHLAVRNGSSPIDIPAGHGFIGRNRHPGLAHDHHSLAVGHGLGLSAAGHGPLGQTHHPGLAHGHHFLALRHGLAIGLSPTGHGPLRRHGSAQPSVLAPSVGHIWHKLERLRLHSGRSQSLSPTTRPVLRYPRAGSVPPSLRHPSRHGMASPRHMHSAMASAGHPRHFLSPSILHAGPHHQPLAMRRRGAPGSIHTDGPRHPHSRDSLRHSVPEAEGTSTVAPLLMHGQRRRGTRGMHPRQASQDAPVAENPPAQETGAETAN
eukprot:TRINITY_DN3104_c0_g2_i1.p1 TRINITY_DN3104_c0_g2~~TRINITY_DN3104_c0_g2_i1.p1  ORF type:complete len:452 (+),score=-15.61 TRINITY_DN3104_c0_g2_i1:185-1357(+)